ncbi:MAG: ERCC4 domain-containing protein [Gemmatimonadaceae bacterium]
MTAATWIVQRTTSRRFPFRIVIQRDGRTLLAVRARSAWPGPGENIFCLREYELDPDEQLETLESVAVRGLTRIGRKLAVILDRPRRKRCEFLVVRKKSRTLDAERGHEDSLRRASGRVGESAPSYEIEQIFFRTEAGIRGHRSRARLELRLPTKTLSIVIDSAERYPWRFPNAEVTRRRLDVGDYALVAGERIMALIERKSFDNLVSDLGAIQALHHQFAHLARSPAAAVVVEARYGDFLDERRLTGRWPPSFVGRALAELGAAHPRLPLVFAGSRKLANVWAYRFFNACAGRAEGEQGEGEGEQFPLAFGSPALLEVDS